jgi:hypothetical protein
MAQADVLVNCGSVLGIFHSARSESIASEQLRFNSLTRGTLQEEMGRTKIGTPTA